MHFTVPVGSSRAEVAKRLAEASKDPTRFVRMFTTSDDVTAEVAEGRNGVWRIKVDGPSFTSKGTAAVEPTDDAQAQIEIQIDVRGKGLLGLAGPLIGLASGKIEAEATEALQREFGAPTHT